MSIPSLRTSTPSPLFLLLLFPSPLIQYLLLIARLIFKLGPTQKEAKELVVLKSKKKSRSGEGKR